MINEEIKKDILIAQRSEITEHLIYRKLSAIIKNSHNKNILKQISDDELRYYDIWKKFTNKVVKPDKLQILKYVLISKIFGLTFGIKLMEKTESKAQVSYEALSKFVSEAKDIVKDEVTHERELIDLIDEERLRYVGSVVLGLNDALVELTGALAGFTLALANSRIIAMAGLITGIAASLSMAASEYIFPPNQNRKVKIQSKQQFIQVLPMYLLYCY